MKTKKIIAAGLIAAMSLGLVACGASNTDTTSGDATTGDQTVSVATPSGHNEEIAIGTWWVEYYDSLSDSKELSPDYLTALKDMESEDPDTAEQGQINLSIAEKKWDNVKKIEDKYDVKFYWQNLTFEGVVDSINTSILAGSPDCDVYRVQAETGIPAQNNGMAINLKDILPADSDVFNAQEIVSYLDLGDDKACLFFPVVASAAIENTYPLAFNVQILEDNNLEDPRELYKRGEWTWDKFVEYMQVCTQDTDGDGKIDQYGYAGFVKETFEQLMMSNGANIAAGDTETLSSPEVGEVLQFIADMYNTYNVCTPYDYTSDDPDATPWETDRRKYHEGNVAFFPIAAWLLADTGEYDWDGSLGVQATWDCAFVRWPVGPSGNQETNAGKNNVAGGLFMIPAGVQEPELVYNVMCDYWNWYDGDTSLRDNKAALNWWYATTGRTEEYQNANFDVMKESGSKITFDLWDKLGVEMDFESLMKGLSTPAQIQETSKLEYQAALDARK